MKNMLLRKNGLNSIGLLERLQQIAPLFSMLVLALSMSACQRNTELDPLSVKIAEQVRMSENTKVNLAALTDFAWDKVHFYSPKQTRDEICADLKWEEAECKAQVEDRVISESFQYLIFTQSSKVVKVVRHKRFFGDFNPPPKTAVNRNRSEFKIYALQNTANGVPWYVLRQN